MYKTTFKDLGGDKACFTVSSDKEPDYDFLYRHAKKHLMSSDIDFAITNEDEEKTEGRVYAGFRNVGEFAIEHIKETQLEAVE